MKSVLTLIALGMLVAACDGLVVIVSTGPTPIDPNVVVTTGGTLFIGTPVSGSLTHDHRQVQYDVVPPHDGLLVVRVSWQPSLGMVEMRIADTPFTCQNRVPPIVGRMHVRGGQSYPVRIMDSAPLHSGTFNLPFEVTTEME